MMKKKILVWCMCMLVACTTFAQLTFTAGYFNQFGINYICPQQQFTLNSVAPAPAGHNYTYSFYEITSAPYPVVATYIGGGSSSAASFNFNYTTTLNTTYGSILYGVNIHDNTDPFATDKWFTVSATVSGLWGLEARMKIDGNYTSVFCDNNELIAFSHDGSVLLPHPGADIIEWQKEDPLNPGSYVFYSSSSSPVANGPGKYRFVARALNAPYPNWNCDIASPPIQVYPSPGLAITYNSASGFPELSPTNTKIDLFEVLPGSPYSAATEPRWYRNGVLVSTSGLLTVTQKGKYTLIAKNVCGDLTSNTIEITEDCDNMHPLFDQTYAAGYTGSGPTLATGGYILGGDIIITGGTFDINVADVYLMPCTNIIIGSGATLTIRGSTLFSCATWQGITLGKSASLFIDNSEIHDAVIGVLAESDPSQIDIRTTLFDNNHIAIAVATLRNDLHIEECKFINVDFTYMGTCTPTGIIFDPSAELGFIKLKDIWTSGSTTIYHNEFYGTSGYLGSHNALDADDIHGTVIDLNYADNLFTAMNIGSSTDLTISNNAFEANNRGVLLRKVKTYQLYMNTFDNTALNASGIWPNNSGIRIYNDYYDTWEVNDVSENTFEQTHTALVIAPNVYPLSNLTNQMNISSPLAYQDIDISCNYFSNNAYGIIGCGPLVEQSTRGSRGVSAGNIFANNSAWDIIWENGGTPNDYNYYISSPVPPNSSGTLSFPTTLINSVMVSTSEMNLNPTGAPSACNNGYRASGMDNETGSNLLIYPNPSADYIEIQGSLAGHIQYEISTINGQMITKGTWAQGDRIQVGSLPQGVYIIRLKNAENIYVQKLIKQ